MYFHLYCKSHCFWRNLHHWQKFYTAAGVTALTIFTYGSIEQGSIVEQGGSVLHEVEHGGSVLHGVEQGGNVVHGVEQEGRKGLLRDFVCAASTGAVPP